MSSSTTTPALLRVGALAAGRATPPPASPQADPHAELARFARAVRPSGLRRLSPLLATLGFSAAVLFVGLASPPSATVRSMLAAGTATAPLATARAGDLPGSELDYRVPAHWQWPHLGETVQADALATCDPASASSAC